MTNKIREIRYLGRDFSTLRNNLINYAKNYFPQNYKNFNESSVGMLFIEMAAYIGDVLGYYIDNNFKESLLLYAEEYQNIYAIAQSLGYVPQISFPASVDLDVFIVVPSNGQVNENAGPDWNYAITIMSDMVVNSEEDSNIFFRTLEDVNFNFSSSDSPTSVAIYETDDNNNPTFYLLKKSVKSVAGEIKESDFSFGEPKRFIKKTLTDENIIDILDATDSDGNTWYHVPYLAQDTIFVDIENVAANDKDLAQYSDAVPYLLKLKKTARRFITRIKDNKNIEIQFGSGISDDPDELLIPNPTNIGSTLFGSVSFTDTPIDPSNFLATKTYGQVPYDTTITIRYTTGGGIESNANENTIRKLSDVRFRIDDESLDSDLIDQVKNSVAVNNPDSATGGKNGETVEEIRQNALANFPTQLRAVTKEDYITRTYSMPSKFGSIAKAYIVQDDQLNQNPASENTDTISGGRPGNEIRIPNPLALNLYVLGYDNNKKLTTLNHALKENLKVYLGQYRMLTDAINIKNGYVVNISLEFDIIVFKNYNKKEVLLKCIEKLKDFFNVDRWQFNQPIILSDVQTELFSVEGVQSVVDVRVFNKYGGDYSENIYDIKSATKDGIIYPSCDPCIFFIQFPNKNITGRAL